MQQGLVSYTVLKHASRRLFDLSLRNSCSHTAMENVDTRTAFMGRWNIVASTLPFWKSGEKRDAIIINEALPGGNGWKDRVEYEAAGMFSSKFKKHVVDGSDRWLGSPEERRFHWRGSGILFFVACDLKIVACDPELKDYAVIYFGKTAITAPGIDVYCRQRDITPARLDEIMAAAYAKDPSLEALVKKAGIILTKRSTDP